MFSFPKYLRTAVPALLIGAAACSQNSSTPVGPSATPDAGPTLTLQHAENLRAIAKERAASNARFADLQTAWANRKDRSGVMTTTTEATFVPCAPLPFDGSAQIIGPAGGVFYFGPHKLTVPAGALSAPVSIAVMVPTALNNQVTLLPHGTQFAVPVKLKLAYGNCDAAASHRVAYVDDSMNVLEWTNSFDFSTAGYVEATLNHFSQYAIAY